MPDEASRIYWDSNVLLSYVDGDADRLPTLDELLRQSRAGDIELLTSTLSQVEVAFAPSEKEQEQLDPEIEARIDEFWLPGSPVKMVEFYPTLAAEARNLMRQALAGGRSGLKGPDAIHLATAARMGARDFHTYDADLRKYEVEVPFPIREPFTAQGKLPGT